MKTAPTENRRLARLGRDVRLVMEWLGWLVFWFWVAASINLIDFHVCLKASGECHP